MGTVLANAVSTGINADSKWPSSLNPFHLSAHSSPPPTHTLRRKSHVRFAHNRKSPLKCIIPEFNPVRRAKSGAHFVTLWPLLWRKAFKDIAGSHGEGNFDPGMWLFSNILILFVNSNIPRFQTSIIRYPYWRILSWIYISDQFHIQTKNLLKLKDPFITLNYSKCLFSVAWHRSLFNFAPDHS